MSVFYYVCYLTSHIDQMQSATHEDNSIQGDSWPCESAAGERLQPLQHCSGRQSILVKMVHRMSATASDKLLQDNVPNKKVNGEI